ncbi:unnamed protein product [Sympodiomycopsis kandeliae]
MRWDSEYTTGRGKTFSRKQTRRCVKFHFSGSAAMNGIARSVQFQYHFAYSISCEQRSDDQMESRQD